MRKNGGEQGKIKVRGNKKRMKKELISRITVLVYKRREDISTVNLPRKTNKLMYSMSARVCFSVSVSQTDDAIDLKATLQLENTHGFCVSLFPSLSERIFLKHEMENTHDLSSSKRISSESAFGIQEHVLWCGVFAIFKDMEYLH